MYFPAIEHPKIATIVCTKIDVKVIACTRTAQCHVNFVGIVLILLHLNHHVIHVVVTIERILKGESPDARRTRNVRLNNFRSVSRIVIANTRTTPSRDNNRRCRLRNQLINITLDDAQYAPLIISCIP